MGPDTKNLSSNLMVFNKSLTSPQLPLRSVVIELNLRSDLFTEYTASFRSFNISGDAFFYEMQINKMCCSKPLIVWVIEHKKPW